MTPAAIVGMFCRSTWVCSASKRPSCMARAVTLPYGTLRTRSANPRSDRSHDSTILANSAVPVSDFSASVPTLIAMVKRLRMLSSGSPGMSPGCPAGNCACESLHTG